MSYTQTTASHVASIRIQNSKLMTPINKLMILLINSHIYHAQLTELALTDPLAEVAGVEI